MAGSILHTVEQMPAYRIPLVILGAFLLLLVGAWVGIVPPELVNKIKDYSGALFQKP